MNPSKLAKKMARKSKDSSGIVPLKASKAKNNGIVLLANKSRSGSGDSSEAEPGKEKR